MKKHYVGPTKQYTGLTSNYQIIPYDTITASVTPKEYLQDALFASAYRVKSHGFNLKLLDMQSMQAKNRTAGTQFMTTFVTDVPLQIWSDPEMIFRLENILPYNDQENIYDVNSQFQVC